MSQQGAQQQWKAAHLPILGRDLPKYYIIQEIFSMVKRYMKYPKKDISIQH